MSQFAGAGGRHGVHHTGGGGGGSGGQSSISLVLFTATIVALIIFTLMKLFSSQFRPSTSSLRGKSRSKLNGDQPDDETDHRCASKHATKQATSKHQQQQQQQQRSKYLNLNNYDAHDQRRDKRKLSGRLSREERTRQLILQHGGKSVSKAIRFLISELEKQKQLLVAQTSNTSMTDKLTGMEFDNNKHKQQCGDDSQSSLVDCNCDCPCHLISESIDCTTDSRLKVNKSTQQRQQVAQPTTMSQQQETTKRQEDVLPTGNVF